jgi:hypothetical protein
VNEVYDTRTPSGGFTKFKRCYARRFKVKVNDEDFLAAHSKMGCYISEGESSPNTSLVGIKGSAEH